MHNPYPCPQTGCNYPEGECLGACLVPAAPRVRHHGLPIDLVEPDAPAPVGDRVPCHLSMPEVAWPVPVGPVIRVRPRREYWLTEAPYRPTPNPGPLEPVGFGLVVALSLGVGFPLCRRRQGRNRGTPVVMARSAHDRKKETCR